MPPKKRSLSLSRPTPAAKKGGKKRSVSKPKAKAKGVKVGKAKGRSRSIGKARGRSKSVTKAKGRGISKTKATPAKAKGRATSKTKAVAAKVKARGRSKTKSRSASPGRKQSKSRSRSKEKISTNSNEKSTDNRANSGKSGLANLRSIRKIYNPAMRFPQWVIEEYDQYSKSASVKSHSRIYGYGGNKSLILELATKREPVNIAQKRDYNKSKLMTEFGWSKAYYQDYWTSKRRLAPNIGILTSVLVDVSKSGGSKVCGSEYEPKLAAQQISMFNAIGLAFDSSNQPDYQYYFETGLSRSQRIKEIKKFYANVFKMVFRCAKDIAAKNIIFSLVGANNFALLYKDEEANKKGIDLFQKTIWAPVFIDFLDSIQGKGITVAFMGAENSVAFDQIRKKYPIQDTGYFPDNVKSNPKSLFVNAWDPLSMPGNGNCGDHSLDGFIGRRTNVAAVGWPLTNPYLKSNIILI